MADRFEQRAPASRTELVVGILFVAVFAGALAIEILQDYSPIKLSAALIVLFWIPLLALHELGHAAMAWLLGWQVRQIVIGMGKILGSFRLGTANVEIRLLPIEGFVRCVPRQLDFPRIKNSLIYAAGPGIELVLAAMILFALGPETLFSLSDDYAVIAWQSLAVAATVQAVINLIPYAVETPEGDAITDGLGMILSFTRPKEHYREMMQATPPEA